MVKVLGYVIISVGTDGHPMVLDPNVFKELSDARIASRYLVGAGVVKVLDQLVG